MSDYKQTLKFLYDLQLFGIKVGLNNIRELLRCAGNRHDQFPCVHIAGTNGKGSTAAMIASILTASGYRTGLYTSPHLVRFNERVRIDGKEINDVDIVRHTKLLKGPIEKNKATFFEATTAIAFNYFAEQKVDIAVVETGLGGRLDATNVVNPIITIITNIGLEHVEYLGPTLAKIAFEKGGIIKPSVSCITGISSPEAIQVLRRIARSNDANLIEAGNVSSLRIQENTLRGLKVSLQTKKTSYAGFSVSLPGGHQAQNLRLAILAVELLQNSRNFPKISERTIVLGLSMVQRYARFRGRIDVLSNQPLLIADVAHNPDGVDALVAALRKLIVGKVVLLFGVMKDKDYSAMIAAFRPMVRLGIAVSPAIDRSLESCAVVQEMQRFGVKAIDGKSVSNGIEVALNEVREAETILLTGSHYVVGEAFRHLKISA